MANFKRVIFLYILLVYCSCDPISKLYTKFGAAKPVLENTNDQVIRLFFDREGTLYPNVILSDTIIKQYDSRLMNLYEQRKDLFEKACLVAQLAPSATTEELQQKQIIDQAFTINKQSEGRQLIILIHGFNKQPLLPATSSAFDEYKHVRDAIEHNYPSRKFTFVEIYWDGCTWVNGRSSREKQNSFKIWDNAQAASNVVALEFRRVLQKLNSPNAIVITHSLGASVITCALFNVIKFKESNYLKEIRAKYRDTVHFKTPVNHFTVAMIAPAIPGENTFDDFTERTPAYSYGRYNYNIIIGFNSHDNVLRKVIGIPSRLGSTTLGCVADELEKSKRIVNINGHQVIDSVDFSNKPDGTSQTDHSFTAYVDNTDSFKTLLKKTIGQ